MFRLKDRFCYGVNSLKISWYNHCMNNVANETLVLEYAGIIQDLVEQNEVILKKLGKQKKLERLF